jgi:hypothetical protein
MCGKEEEPYCPSSSAEATAEEATVRSPLLTKMKFGKTALKWIKDRSL